MIGFRFPLAVLALLCMPAPSVAGPAMSVKLLTVKLPVDACVHRAARVYELEGYTVSPGNEYYVWGDKGPHGAAIICTPAGGVTQVSVVVAEDPSGNSDAAMHEVDRLAFRLEELARDRNWERRR